MSSLKPMTEPEKDEHGSRIITVRFIKSLCEQQGFFDTPRLNKRLFLHFQGFVDIRNLDEYTNLRALWLENNWIRKIEGLNALVNLRCLYLQNNQLEKLENLDSLTELVNFNVSYNRISKIEGLERLVSLEDLHISHNKITSSESLYGLADVPSLMTLDISSNELEDNVHVLPVLESLPNLACLYVKEIEWIRGIENYRKILIVKLKNLNYLNERPISERERLNSETWWASQSSKSLEELWSRKIEDVTVEVAEEEKGEENDHEQSSDSEVKFEKLPISELSIEELEQLLVTHFFNFEKVHSILSSKFKCSPESIRLKWSAYELEIRGNSPVSL
ncbi:unnamed protein product [Blepharisma stoltei]|uniref:Uncharacterized protein n=1 Tax=Blepharisma stoltei TaxID=1481888 RepID=A0AAU9IPY4_9CILI|nr:unnamed protein product [Blepharisma stoltei]